jgi:hypothetical protein
VPRSCASAREDYGNLADRRSVSPDINHQPNKEQYARSYALSLRQRGLTMFNVQTVLNVIGDPCLKLYRKGYHKGYYWYFEFDDNELFATKRVMVSALNDLPLDTWVGEGRTFAAAMRARQR